MNIRQFRYSADNLGYLVYSNGSAMAIDGGATKEILSFLSGNMLSLKYVTNTHSHPDHISGNRMLLDRSDAEFLDFTSLIEKGEIELGGGKIRVLHTPGHTSDSVCFHFDNVLVSGDTLFNGKVGKCFTGDTTAFFNAIKALLQLPGNTYVYGGHDYVEEYMEFARQLEPENPNIDEYMKAYNPDHVCYTLGEEIRVDPFLQFNDEKIKLILQSKGLPADTELDRWQSLMALM